MQDMCRLQAFCATFNGLRVSSLSVYFICFLFIYLCIYLYMYLFIYLLLSFSYCI
jgi:hypothetical protein